MRMRIYKYKVAAVCSLGLLFFLFVTKIQDHELEKHESHADKVIADQIKGDVGVADLGAGKGHIKREPRKYNARKELMDDIEAGKFDWSLARPGPPELKYVKLDLDAVNRIHNSRRILGTIKARADAKPLNAAEDAREFLWTSVSMAAGGEPRVYYEDGSYYYFSGGDRSFPVNDFISGFLISKKDLTIVPWVISN